LSDVQESHFISESGIGTEQATAKASDSDHML